MAADVFYAIGSTHHVCQDFAVANGEFVILADGCSSAEQSDWGARLLVKACHNVIKERSKPLSMDFPVLKDAVLTLANSYVKTLDLNQDCLAATLLCAYKSDKGNVINAFITGDGFIIAHHKKADNLMVMFHNYETGAPYYLYYSLNEGLRKSYFDNFGTGKFEVENRIVGGGGHQFFVTSKPLDEAKFIHYVFPVDEYDMVAVVSDGLKSFVQQVKGTTSIQNQSIEYMDVVKDLVGFKSATGQFVHRRCQKVMRDYAAKGIRHTDDFSMGVIHADD